MSDKNIIEKAADVIGNVTKFQKQSKLKVAYLERDEFKDSDLHTGFFCYNCIYWVDSMGGKCMIVNDKGPDIFGRNLKLLQPMGVVMVMNQILVNLKIQIQEHRTMKI